jgi:hypothetical protein
LIELKKSIVSVVLPALIIAHFLSLSVLANNDKQLFASMRNKQTSYFKCSYNGGKKMGVKKIGVGPTFQLYWVDGVSQTYSYVVGAVGRMTYNYDLVDSLGGKWNEKGGTKLKDSFILTNIVNNNTISCSTF